MMHPEEKEQVLELDLEDVLDELDEEIGPPTLRSDRIYQRLVRSERPTVPPPAQSHIRDLLGTVVIEVDDDEVDEAAQG
jgi:hypothetical protein